MLNIFKHSAQHRKHENILFDFVQWASVGHSVLGFVGIYQDSPHWYETAAQCIRKINTIRPIGEFLKEGIIGDLKDVADFKTVCELAGQPEFWKWISAFNKFTKKAEKFRLWGNGCTCHNAEFLLRMKVTCNKLSRRLHEAFDFVTSFLSDLVVWVNGLTLADCEGDRMIFKELTFVVRRFIPECRLKYSFTGEAPYILSNVCTPRFAKMFVDQCMDTDRVDQHPNTLRVAEQYIEAITEIVGGNTSNIPDGLAAEQEIYRRIPLSSQRAEGYHRTTRLSKIRGATSKIPWILASSRLDQNLDLLESQVEDSPLGESCFVAEYRSFSRILQTRAGVL